MTERHNEKLCNIVKLHATHKISKNFLKQSLFKAVLKKFPLIVCDSHPLCREPDLTAAVSLGALTKHPHSFLPILFFQTLLSQDEMLNDSRFLTPTFEDWR